MISGSPREHLQRGRRGKKSWGKHQKVFVRNRDHKMSTRGKKLAKRIFPKTQGIWYWGLTLIYE